MTMASSADSPVQTCDTTTGLSRRNYWIIIVALMILRIPAELIGSWLGIFIGLAAMVAIALRVKNIGYSVWWTLLTLLLPWTFLVGLACGVCPSGFSRSRTLDKTGVKIGWGLIGITALAYAVFLIWIAIGSKR
ncbi:MAG: hypothetical protein WC701_13465 [Kiritimatiellales bacterium]